MTDKKNKEKKFKSFEEKILDSFPDDWKPDYKPQDFDAVNDTAQEIIAKTGVKEIFMKMMIEESDKKGFSIFWDALVEKNAEKFHQLREGLKNDNTRRELLKKIIEEGKYGKRK